MSSRSLVIFDCDGVLVDSERLTVALEERYLAEIGWPLSQAEIVERFVGRTEAAMIAAIEEQIGRPVPAEWHRRWLADTQAALDESLEPVPGVRGAIEALAADGHGVCVGSSGRPEKIERSLTTTGLLWLFDAESDVADGAPARRRPSDGRARAIFSASEVSRGKPEPDLFLLAAETMGARPESCVVVEDSRHGIAAALAAGMRAVGFTASVAPVDHLVDADLLIDDMADLPLAVRELVGRPS